MTKAYGRCRSRGRTDRAHRSLENHRPVFHKRPQATPSFCEEERQGTFLFRENRGHFYFALTDCVFGLLTRIDNVPS